MQTKFNKTKTHHNTLPNKYFYTADSLPYLSPCNELKSEPVGLGFNAAKALPSLIPYCDTAETVAPCERCTCRPEIFQSNCCQDCTVPDNYIPVLLHLYVKDLRAAVAECVAPAILGRAHSQSFWERSLRWPVGIKRDCEPWKPTTAARSTQEITSRFTSTSHSHKENQATLRIEGTSRKPALMQWQTGYCTYCSWWSMEIQHSSNRHV